MRRGAARRHALTGALLLALVLFAGPGSASSQESGGPLRVDVDVRVWQGVSDPELLYISARASGGRWDALGTIRLHLDRGLTADRDERFGDVRVDGVEIRVWQRVAEPRRIHVGARATGGDRDDAGRVPLPLDDGVSPAGHYRYGDVTLSVALPEEEQAVSVSPGGDDVPRLAALTIAFRHPPVQADPRALVSVEPEAPGSFAWLDDRTLLFQPDYPGWARGERYEVSLDAEAAGLDAGHVHHFTAEGLLEVAYVIPGDGDEEVPSGGRILVQFSRSVAPLTLLQKAGSPAVLEFDPPLAGEGEWLNTSLYRFTPDDLRPHTEYRVRIPAGLTSAADGVLGADYEWSFTTIQPAVRSFEPQDGALHVEPDSRVVATFNQPMERASVESGLTLHRASAEQASPQPGSREDDAGAVDVPARPAERASVEAGADLLGAPGEKVAAAYEWSADSTAVTLIPEGPLALGGAYVVVAREGLRGADGGETRSGRSAGFRAVDTPRLTSTSPQDGETDAYCCSIRLTYNNPMDPESFPGRIFINGEVLEEDRIYARGAGVSVWGVLEYDSEYTVRLADGIRDRGGRALPAHEFSFSTRPRPANIAFTTPGAVAVLPEGSGQVVEYRAWRIEEIRFRLYRLSGEESQELLRRGYVNRGFRPGSNPIRDWTQALPRGGAATIHAAALDAGGRLAGGHYFLVASADDPDSEPLPIESLPAGARAALPEGLGELDDIERTLIVSVVDTTLVTKHAHDELLVWALDYASGEPIAGVEVSAVPAGDARETGGDTVQRASTDPDGLARFAIPPVRGSYYRPYGDYLVRVDGGGRTGVALTWWETGQYRFDPGVPVGGYFAGPVAHLYSDRPLYRPGETVFYKGVVRADDDASYAVPEPGTSLTLRIRDPRYELVEESALTVDELGALAGELVLPGDAATGDYRLTLSDPGGRFVAGAHFTVAEFRVPELWVAVETTAPDAVSGDRVAAEARATFFFGGPAREAEVSWRALSSPTAFRAEGYERYSFSEYRRSETPPLRAEGDAQTDEAGSAAFEIPTALDEGEGTQLFTVSATVTDASAQAVAGSTTLTVHPAAVYAGIAVASSVATAAEPLAVELVTLDTSGRAAPGRPVELRLVRREWVTTLEKTEDGDYRYRSELRESTVETLSATTGADAEATVSVTPAAAGSYRLVSETVDGEGRVQRSARSLWVSGDGHAPWRVSDDEILTLVPDRERYEVGDVARVLVPAPFAGVTGLVTLERGRVLEGEVRRFETNSEVLLIPIEAGHRPNIYVGVVLYRPPTQEDPLPRVRIGYVNLPVATDALRLDVRVEPERDRAAPGETVRYEVEVTDHLGRGVSADVSVAIVDEAVLSLLEESGRDGMETFWSERALGVRTAWTRSPTERQGGMDSDMAAAAPAARAAESGVEGPGVSTRSDFRNTALWLGQLRTDASGRAAFELELPDNATTWRALARAATAGTEVGEGESELLVTKPLLVRPALPRFLRVGDEVTLRTLVRNGTERPLDITVAIEARGLVLAEQAARTVRAEPGDSVVLSWPALAASAGEARVRFEATAPGVPGDAVELTLPVHLDVTAETTATGGVVEQGAALEALYLPGYALTDHGSLEISLQGSLVGALDEELAAFAPHPSESHVRVASRLVATLAAERANAGAPDEAQESRLRSDIDRLVRAQRGDGGWGWCRECATDLWVTGWVLTALGEARGAGHDVSVEGYERTARLIARHVGRETDVERPANPSQHAFLLYALASSQNAGGEVSAPAREQGPALRTLVEEERAQLTSWGRAYALLGLLAAGAGAGDPDVRVLANDLAASALSSANGNHWEDAPIRGSMHNSGVRATALVLRALAAASPEHPLLEETVRWLVLARAERRWQTSVERAEGMAALGAFAELTGERRGAYDYRVLLGTRSLLDGHFDVAAGDRLDGVALPLAELPRGEVSRVQLERGAGEGRLYYDLALRYVTPAEGIEAAGRGFSVSHRYSLLDDPETAVTSAPAGAIVRVSVTVLAPAERLFARVQDFLPAGLEPVDPRLDVVPEWLREQLRREQAEARRRHAPPYVAPWYGWYYSPWDQIDLRDDRLVLLASRLPPGVHEYVYYARATTPGDFFVAPAHAEEAYFPEVFGRSDSGRFTVTDGEEEASASLSGAVYLRGGEVALPAGAVVTVKLVDISLADASAVTLGEHVIEGASMLPAEFRIAYDPGHIAERSDYALEATVRHRGRLLYINDTVQAVLTHGNPAQRDIEVVPVR